MALEEAMRPITVREGDRVEQLPAMQAVLRAMFRAAAHHDAKAQRQILDLVTGAESARSTAATDQFVSAMEARQRGLELIAEHKRKGLPPPELYPHPFDIITDEATGEITIDGPTSKEQAGAELAGLKHAVEGLGRYYKIEEQLKSDPHSKELQKQLREHQAYKRFFDKLSRRNVRRMAIGQSHALDLPAETVKRPRKTRGTAVAKAGPDTDQSGTS